VNGFKEAFSNIGSRLVGDIVDVATNKSSISRNVAVGVVIGVVVVAMPMLLLLPGCLSIAGAALKTEEKEVQEKNADPAAAD